MSVTPRFAGGLSGNQLKLFALVVMTIDHIGMLLLPQLPVLRIIGRMAFPIFAYMVAEGCTHTRHRLRYLLTMAGAALTCQLVYWLALGSLDQGIFVTFTLSIVMCFAVDHLMRKPSLIHALACVAAVALSWMICSWLPDRLSGFSVEYGFAGAILPVLIFIGRTKPQRLLLTAVGIALTAWDLSQFTVQWFAMLSLIPLMLYNGERGKWRLKYLFYIYYPLHLAILYGLAMWL